MAGAGELEEVVTNTPIALKAIVTNTAIVFVPICYSGIMYAATRFARGCPKGALKNRRRNAAVLSEIPITLFVAWR
jgi:hypothetical protein